MSVIGIDFGYQTCTIAAPKTGGIEVLLNEYSQRATASSVSFTDKQRELGESSRMKEVTNFKRTVSKFKPLLGRAYADADVQAMLSKTHYKHRAMPDGTTGVNVTIDGVEATYSIVQITAMLLGQLKRAAEADLKSPVKDCVIGVPISFNDRQRHALLAASKIAGLNCLRIFNETSATALAYGIYKQDLPAEGEKPRRVVFCDLGASQFQLSACDMVKGKLTVMATASTPIGGKNFDQLIYDHVTSEFKAKHGDKCDVSTNSRAQIRVMGECEKLKKLMSANSTKCPLNIECLMNDLDVASGMKREDFEAMAAPLMEKIESTCKELLATLNTQLDGKSKLEDIDVVEIVGGAARMPMFKRTITAVFGKEPSTTLNLDEAVSRGAGLQAAIVSPAFRVRDFSIIDKTPYGMGLTWKSALGDEDSEAEVFKPNSNTHLSKLLTFYRDSDFDLQASYKNTSLVPGGVAEIGTFTLQGVKPAFDGTSNKIKAKIRLDEHGCFTIDEASMVEKLPPQAEEEVKEEAPAPAADAPASDAADKPSTDAKDDDAKTDADAATPPADAAKADEKAEDKKEEPVKKKAKTTKTTSLTVETKKPGLLNASELNLLIEAENALAAVDRSEREKADAKNALEEYIYASRDKVSTDWEKYFEPAAAEKFSASLTEAEDWLYDEGEDETKTVYVAKLAELTKVADPVVTRVAEAAIRPAAIEDFQKSVVVCRKFVEEKASGAEKYAHITDADVEKVSKSLAEKEKWLNDAVAKQAATSNYEPVAFYTSQFVNEREAFERVYTPIMNKPAPKVEPPPAAADEEPVVGSMDGKTVKKDAPAADDAAAPAADGAEKAPEEPAGSTMEID